MDKKELCSRLLEELPFHTMEIKKKNFCTLSFGRGGYIWVVRKGLMMSVRNTEDGRYKALGIFDAGSLIGVAGLTDETRHITAYTLSKTVLSFVPVKEALALLQRDNQLCYYFMLYLSRNLLDTFNDLEINTLGTLEDRIRAFEGQIAQKNLPKDASFSEVVMAMAVGAHPGSISRIRKQLKKNEESEKAKANSLQIELQEKAAQLDETAEAAEAAAAFEETGQTGKNREDNQA
ncbi:MAG: Crp/Fnr family transcriptional regulator [Clostridiales bacterium]